MPNQNVRYIEHHSRIGCWELSESLEELRTTADTAGIGPIPGHITHEHKRKEWLAQRLILSEMEGPKVIIKHAISGAPYLEGCTNGEKQVSISHCNGVIVVLTNTGPYCGIDIASIDSRATKIRKRFLSETEAKRFADTNQMNTTLWACKEAAFKAYNLEGIVFKEDIIIEQLEEDWALIKLCKLDDALVKFAVEQEAGYVLVYTLNQ